MCSGVVKIVHAIHGGRGGARGGGGVGLLRRRSDDQVSVSHGQKQIPIFHSSPGFEPS